MDHAWLDSLSEDWISQHASSGSPAPSLPSMVNSISSSSRAASRIPKYNPQRQAWIAANEPSNSPLSERSPNENNVPFSQRSLRQPSKLREVTNGDRGRRLSRTFSASTINSVQYHTVQHKSHSLSPTKGRQETPEWKRRLIHGEVAYGEQRDLFSAAGLEAMFQPPPEPLASPTKLPNVEEDDVSILPSSPPPYNLPRVNGEKQNEQDNPEKRQQPRGMKYRLTDMDGSEFSANDLSRGSSFQFASRSFQDTEEGNSDPASEIESSVLHQKLNAAGRTASGQSDVRNEDLSPIFISRHNTMDGKIGYAALNLPTEELQRRLEDISEETPVDDQSEDSGHFLANITVETEDFAHNGRFVNLRRGGQSQEGSFQQRMLSPSSLSAIEESAIMPEESIQISTQTPLPNIKKTRTSNEHQKVQGQDLPRTPSVSPSRPAQKEQQGSSGSPLKLFGTYDTFTNQKLLRRLSQFEGDFEYGKVGAGEVAQGSGEQYGKDPSQRHTSTKLNSFGQGDLDGFQFSEEVSYDSVGSQDQDEDKENVSLPRLNPDTQSIFRFQLEPSPALGEEVVSTSRTRYTASTRTSKHTISVRRTRPGTSGSNSSSTIHPSQRQEDLQTPRKRTGDSEGKRLPKTPLKDPTPKRRRTLQKVDMDLHEEDESLALDSLRETHQQMQSVIGKKRKDARHGDDQQAANPKVLAMRQILRPRTPTPSQRSSHNERPPLAEIDIDPFIEQARLTQQEKIAQIQAELDAPPLKLLSALGMSQQMQSDSRKGSVTTQDFLDEAKKIMAGIRDKVRPRSGLASVEESESDNDKNISPGTDYVEDEFEESYQESTKEPFSRPPSRDGKPIARLPMIQEDPALLDHLRKYQEMSDFDGVVTSSMKSLALNRASVAADKEPDQASEKNVTQSSTRFLVQERLMQSDPPNIRISENPDHQRKRKHSTSSILNSGEFLSQGSNSSAGQSTSRSILTGSSRGSDSRRVIAPHNVRHLIPEEVAGMIFDRENNIWVKRKSVSAECKGESFLASDETEDDPFGDIPDLSIDETQERQRIKSVNAKRKEDARITQQSLEDGSEQESKGIEREEHEPVLPLANRDNQHSASRAPNLVQSNSGQPTTQPRTKLSSRVAEHRFATSPSRAGTTEEYGKAERVVRKTVVEEVEKEISILEDRVDPTTPRRRNVTITFSSPVASVIRPAVYQDDRSLQSESEDDNDSDGSDNTSVVVTKARERKTSTMRSALRNGSRLHSLGGHMFSTRPVSRIDERDEESSTGENKMRDHSSISIIVSATAQCKREASVVLATPRPSHEIGTLTLTPLSDFTVHHEDRSLGLDVSYVAGGQRYVMGNGKSQQKTLSHSIKKLIEKLTEVEPYEPFWEHLKKLELMNKDLANLHKLNEFCGALEDLDVSHNQLSQLDGIPTSLRYLRITHNSLTELTAWGHLNNLQYIDVSHNDLESLSPFRYLKHLRSLTADNNKIRSLNGVNELDGLLTLRLRNNSLESCDFNGSKLQRLTELDLASNTISDIRNVQELHSLSILNLEDNCISDFSPYDFDAAVPLTDLRLSGNDLSTIDVRQFPNLRLLYLDRNCLGKIDGLSMTKSLDNLSVREQQDGCELDVSFINEIFEIRKLSLSGNYLGSFQPQVEFMNLQYLELANCGLESLPHDFGLMLCNVRVLNLNFNALNNLKPLLGIRRLKKLHIAGNRILRLRTTARVLGKFQSLTLADLRGNPLTIGFYPPMAETQMVLLGHEHDADSQDPFILGRADRSRDEKYVQRLDMQTRMLRRTFEILVLGDCPKLRVFDGLDVDMSVVIRKDATWQGLVNSGVLRVPALESAPVEGREGEQKGSKSEKANGLEEDAGMFNGSAQNMSAKLCEKVTKDQDEILERIHHEETAARSSVLDMRPTEQHDGPPERTEEEERWPAEDSFA